MEDVLSFPSFEEDIVPIHVFRGYGLIGFRLGRGGGISMLMVCPGTTPLDKASFSNCQ